MNGFAPLDERSGPFHLSNGRLFTQRNYEVDLDLPSNMARIVTVLNTHNELVAALGDAIIQVQKDALKLGNSAHGRHLQELANHWTILFNRAVGLEDAESQSR